MLSRKYFRSTINLVNSTISQQNIQYIVLLQESKKVVHILHQSSKHRLLVIDDIANYESERFFTHSLSRNTDINVHCTGKKDSLKMNYRNQLAANSSPKKKANGTFKTDRAAMAAWAFVGITLAVLVLDSIYLALYFGCLARGRRNLCLMLLYHLLWTFGFLGEGHKGILCYFLRP